MEEEIRIKIVALGRDSIHRTVERVSLYASDGFMEVHPDHAPIVFMLGTGICELFNGRDGEKFAVYDGVGHFVNNELTLCPDNYEFPEDVDVERAQKSLKRANLRIAGKDPEVPKRNLQLTRAHESRNRSMIRLKMRGVTVDE